MTQEILNKIQEYSHIVLYRHVNPDYDAFGSQFGLYDLIKNNFPEKHLYVAGNFDSDLVEKFEYPGSFDLPDFQNDVLGIVLDTANRERIDGDYQLCKELIKIDHHIVVDSYGVVNFENSQASSCSQMIATILINHPQLKITKLGASQIYMGIIGDTSRFLFNSTSDETFQVAAYLYQQGIQLDKIYNRMYLKKAKDLEITKFIYNHYHVDENLVYYVLKDEDLKFLNIKRERGSDFVNMFSQIDEFEVWMAITENIENHNWRVSIRSRSVVINEIAQKYNGGGHAFASGATLESIDQLPLLIQDLKEVIHEFKIL